LAITNPPRSAVSLR